MYRKLGNGKIQRNWLLVGALFFCSFTRASAGGVVVTPLCENATTSSPERGQKELLSAVKTNRPQMVMMLTSKGTDINMKTDSGDSLLHVAVMCGSNEVTRTLLKLGEDPNVRGQDRTTPLYRAVEINDLTAMKELYDKGADVHVTVGSLNNTLLHLACQKGHAEAVDWLFSVSNSSDFVDVRNIRGYTPLHDCALYGHLKLTTNLIEKGANIHARNSEGETALHFAAGRGHGDVVQYLIKKGAKIDAATHLGLTPLHRAAEFGHAAIADHLLTSRASVNTIMNVLGISPLHLAIFDLKTVRTLINHGADVNLKTHDGETPLHWASSGASSSQTSVLRELVDRGSDVNSQMRNGWTPLHIACLHGLRKNAEYLLENGASADEKDINGRVPLHFAAAIGDLDLVKLLLNAGSPADVKDADGETPSAWAANSGHTSLAEYLTKRRN